MTKKTEVKKTRQPYHKPQLEQVELVAEEAVLTACKIQGGTVYSQQNTNCLPSTCLAQGS